MGITIRDVAKEAGISYATVSNVINNKQGTLKISEKTQKKVWAAIHKTGYQPNMAARALANGRTNTVACLIDAPSGAIANPFFGPILSGVESVLMQRGYSMLIESSAKYLNPNRDIADTTSMQAMIMPDAFLILSADQHYDFSLLKNKPTAFVACNATCEGSAHITINEHIGATMAAEHLIQEGHKHIAILRPPAGGEADTIRFEATKATLEKAGLSASLIGVGDNGDPEGGQRAMTQVIHQGVPFSAVIAFNDNMAMGAMDVLSAKGLRVPKDVSIIGFDDIPLVSQRIGLTTIHVPLETLGTCATQQLTNHLKDPSIELKDHTLDVSLIIRDTTSAPPS